LTELQDLGTKLESRFGDLAGKAVETAHDQFLKRAEEKLGASGKESAAKLETLLQPMKDTLQRYEADLRQLEKDRKGAYEGLNTQISIMREGQERVASEALRLRTALRSSTGDVGRWGEEQCRNVLEQAGLQEGIDFEEQVSTDAIGDRSKPDFIVNVPGNRRIIIDVKCSVDAYIGATETDDEAIKEKLLGDHMRAIRAHSKSLMQRSYQDKFKNSATFVVMFIPGENFLHAAIQRDSKLLSDGHKGNVIIVGPTNLLSIVLNVAALRDQARLAERAEEIGALGRKLYENISTLGRKAHAMSGAVRSVVRNWNELVSTLDGHWLSTAREFDKLGVGKGSIDVREVEPLELDIHEPRKLGLEQDNDEEEPPQIAAE
jgi:DNA recombination protein RmuC